MADTDLDRYFVPVTKIVKLASGAKRVLVKGIATAEELGDELVHTAQGLEHGIKPVTEMLEHEWASLGTTLEIYLGKDKLVETTESQVQHLEEASRRSAALERVDQAQEAAPDARDGHPEVEQDAPDGGGAGEDKQDEGGRRRR